MPLSINLKISLYHLSRFHALLAWEDYHNFYLVLWHNLLWGGRKTKITQ
jgi:hypothetical protein